MGLNGRKYHSRPRQQHAADDSGSPRGTQHCAALSGPHGRNILHRLLPEKVQEQCLFPWQGEELTSL